MENKKKNILIFSLAYHPFVGGAELAMEEITKRLPDYAFHLVTYRFDSLWPKEETIGNVHVYRVGRGRSGASYYGRTAEKFLFMALAFFKGYSLHLKHRYSVFWALMASRASAPALFLKFFFPDVQYFLTIQEGDTPEYAHKRAGILLPFWRLAFRYADQIQVISSYLRDIAIQEGGHSDRITIIPNGVDLHIFSRSYSAEEKNILRGKLGIADNEKVIITTSRLVPKNGVDILIDSIPTLLKEVPHVKVCIIGSGPDETVLKTKVEQLRLRGSVLFLGEVLNAELPLYLSISDVFVRPSRSEGLGTAFLEAMAARVPIVGTAVGGIPDFLVNRETGLFAKSEDPKDLSRVLSIILQDRDLQKTIVENASRLITARYDWNLIAGEFDLIFRRLIDEKRILIVSGSYPPDSGGSATYSSLLMRELPKLGFTPTLLTYGAHNPKESHIIRISRAYPKGIRHIVFFAYCLWLSLSSKLIFSVDASMGGGLPARLASVCTRKNFFVRVTGEYAWEQGMARFGVKELLDDFQSHTYGITVEMMRAIEHWIVRGADIVIAPSEYLKKIVGGWGIDHQKIITIFNAQDISLASNISKNTAREKLGLPGDVPILLSIGRLLPWKGFPALIEVMKGVVREHSGARLLIVDDGPEYERLKTKISNCGLEEHIFLTGKVSHEKVALYLRAADVFVLNTGYEGFSHILIEALASGIPVITTNVGGNPEIIENGANGILVPYNDKEELQKNILLLLHSPKKREELAEKGIESAKKFTLPIMMKSLEKILIRHCI